MRVASLDIPAAQRHIAPKTDGALTRDMFASPRSTTPRRIVLQRRPVSADTRPETAKNPQKPARYNPPHFLQEPIWLN